MITNATLSVFASSLVSHQRSSPLATHFRSLAIFCFFSLFRILLDLLSFFLHVAFFFFFLLEADCCLSGTAATCCETNSLKYGQKFWITKARILILTHTWKRKKMKVADEKSPLVSEFDVKCPANTVAFWGNMKTPAGPVNLLAEYTWRHFNTLLAWGHVVIYTPV